MSYCRRCDRELIEDARYCSYCGASVGTTMEEYSVSSEDLIKKVKDLIHEGNVTRLVVRDERGQNLLEIPVTVGVIGALIAP